jgi:capsid protein
MSQKPPKLYGPTGRLLPTHRKPRDSAAGILWDYAWDVAKRTDYRGWFWFPDLEPNLQMPRQTREIAAKKANWLYNNVGAVAAVIDGLGLDEVDTGLWPRATTSNPAFNKAVTDRFDAECGEARVFHSAATEDFYSAQWLIRRSIRMYGDLFGQLLRPSSPGGAPQCHFVPQWQVDNALVDQDQQRWNNGIFSNPLGRPLMFRTLLNKERTQWRDVSADDMMHFHDKFLPGQKRGMSGLSSVARKLYSMDDIEKAETSGVLLRTRLAYAITSKDDAGDGAPSLVPGASEVSEVIEGDTADGGKLLVQKIMARDGSEIDVADLPAGKDIKLIESQRDSAAVEYRKSLLTDVAYSQLYPPEYVFFLAGMTQGTVARLVQNRVQRVINAVRRFQLIPQFCKRWYTYWLWQDIKAGEYDDIEGGVPDDWYRHMIIVPKDMTVDVGREGRLYDDRLATGKMSGREYHGMNGHDEEDVEDEVIEAAIRRRQKVAKRAEEAGIELRYEDVFVPPPGSVASQPQQSNNDE